MLIKVLGLIWRPSFSSYRFSLNLSLWDLHKRHIIVIPQPAMFLFLSYWWELFLDTETRLKRSHCLNIGAQSSQSNVQPLSHGENLLKICGDHLSLDAKSPICRYGHTVLPPHGHHGPSVIGHNRLKDGRDKRDSASQSLSMHLYDNKCHFHFFLNMQKHFHKIDYNIKHIYFDISIL